jgi:hypothetical protein
MTYNPIPPISVQEGTTMSWKADSAEDAGRRTRARDVKWKPAMACIANLLSQAGARKQDDMFQ